MPIFVSFARRRLRAALTAIPAVFVCLYTFLLPAGAAAVPPGPPPGYARIWLYRDYEPYVSLATPYVRFNGAIVGVSEPGRAVYRDVPPGGYYVTVDSEGSDVNQFVSVAAAAGQQIYIKVEALRYWDCGGGGNEQGGGGGWCRPTFYTRLQLPDAAAAEVARGLFRGGG